MGWLYLLGGGGGVFDCWLVVLLVFVFFFSCSQRSWKCHGILKG